MTLDEHLRSSGESAGTDHRAPTKESNNRSTVEERFALMYHELERLASFVVSQEGYSEMTPTELVHETYLRLRQSAHLAPIEDSHFKAIAARAMRQVMVDFARKRRASKRSSASGAIVESLDSDPVDPKSLVDNVRGTSRNDITLTLDLIKAISKLDNPRDRLVMQLYCYQQFDIEAIADRMHISPSSVHLIRERAIKKLREHFYPQKKS